MDINFYCKGSRGTIRRVTDQHPKVADKIYRANAGVLGNHLTTFYRITMTDPGAGDRVIRDTYIDYAEVAT